MDPLTFFRFYGWIGGLALLLILTGSFIWRAQYVPPPDKATLLAYIEEYERQTREHLGPPVPERHHELSRYFEDRERTPLNAVPNLLGAAGFDLWMQRHGDALEELAQLGTEGITNHMMFDPVLRGAPARNDMPNLLILQNRARVHLLLSRRAAEREDWDTALRHLRYAAHVGTPVRFHYVIGHLIAVATRNMAYHGYLRLLGHDLPAEVLQQALADLEELRATDPVFDEWVRTSEGAMMLRHLLSFEFEEYQDLGQPTQIPAYGFRYMNLLNAVLRAISHREHLTTPSLRRYAERHSGLLDDWDGFVPLGVLDQTAREGLRWTHTAGVTRFLRRIAENEPEFVNKYILDMPFDFPEGDAWTRTVYLAGYSPPRHFEVSETRARTTQTSGEFARQAFAARLHLLRTGEWPETTLEQAEVARIIAEVADRADKPFLPLQSRVHEGPLDPVLTSMWLRSKTPAGFASSFSGEELPDGRLSFWARFDSNIPARELLGLAGQFEPVAEHMKIYLDSTRSSWSPGETPLRATRSARDELWERLLGEGVPSPAVLYPDPQYYDTADIVRRLARFYLDEGPKDTQLRTLANRISVHVEGTLHPPEDVRILWSPGPDGRDGRGRIPYDPTNGTRSAGDIIVFPERFQ